MLLMIRICEIVKIFFNDHFHIILNTFVFAKALIFCGELDVAFFSNRQLWEIHNYIS